MNEQDNMPPNNYSQKSKNILVIIVALVVVDLITAGAIYLSSQSNLIIAEQKSQQEVSVLENRISELEKQNSSLKKQKASSPIVENKTSVFTLDSGQFFTLNTTVEIDSWPTEIVLKSNDKNITRKINVVEREQCYTEHAFGFETYSGDFTTKNGQKLNRLSYPDRGSDSLFVIDEYGFNLENGHCLTFVYSAVITDSMSLTGEYDEKIYANELDIAAKTMESLTIPSK